MRTKLSIFCNRILEAGWLVAVVAVPLFFNIYTARTFEPDKITLLRSIVSVMILAWIVMTVEQSMTMDADTTPGQRIRNLIQKPLFLPTVLLVVAYIISTIFSISPKVSLWGSYQRLQGSYSFLSYVVVFALMAGNLRTRAQVDRLVTIIIITSIPISLYGIVQKYGLDPLPWAGDVTRRVASNMGNAIFVASYLIMVMPLTLVRLIESMTAIITEEEASWGHTILAAVYIFILAVQTITVIFSGSRGPMVGILGAFFVMGLLIVLILRQADADSSSLSPREFGLGIIFVIPLGLAAAVGGGLGYVVGLGLEKVLVAMNYQLENITLMGLLLGGMLGLFGLFAYMAAAERGWRWLWVGWLSLAGTAIGFLLLLNIQGTPLDPYLQPLRETPYLSRLARVTETESGTGRVRVLIWDAAIELAMPHQPLGIPGDEVAPADRFNFLRPLIGYGPESMFNAFAYVYPPDLAHVEKRGSSADRSHNETVDSLVITGLFGFLAFYFLMVSLFYYGGVWLGWTASQGDKRRLLAVLLGSGLLGGVIAYIADGGLTFVPLGLPFGLIGGLVLYLIWQGFVTQEESSFIPKTEEYDYTLLLIGLLGAIIGHFIEVHFVFSIVATYTYFWVYAGLLVAVSVIVQQSQNAETGQPAESEPAPVEPQESRRSRSRRRRGRKRSAAAPKASAAISTTAVRDEKWETWLGVQGLAMAIILIILSFDFITPQFQLFASKDTMSLLWMILITWSVGAAIAFANIAVQRDKWANEINWMWAVILYMITSLAYFFFYTWIHLSQFGRRINVTTMDDVIRAANVLANGLLIFYLFLFLLMVLLALTLSWQRGQRLPFWRTENWWLYPPLLLAIGAIIWFKNYNVVRADIYLKEGERYRGNKQWDQAIALHDLGRSIDSDEDFYYLMLALDYQLMAQDGKVDQQLRNQAWARGEQIALEARNINPYNPDNTGNMGRYYFTLGQVLGKKYYEDAVSFFEKATTLAPSNVIYHNLWAQTYYILQDYPAAIDRLQTSISIDGRYPPSWVLLGDTYAAQGNVDKALAAHTEGMSLDVRGSDGWRVFADQFVDQRLNFYVSSGRMEDILASMEQVAEERPDNPQVRWAIGHTYNIAGQRDQAVRYLEQARTLLNSQQKPNVRLLNRTLQELGNIYLASDQFEEALPNYEFLVQNGVANVEVYSALAYIYAQVGRLEEAIRYNQLVLEQRPNDYDSQKNLAILYQQTERWTEALEAAQQAMALAPEEEQASWQQFIATIQNQLDEAG